MNGTKYVFDTNTLINFLQGNPELRRFSGSAIYLSLISVIEFLSFSNLEEDDKVLLFEFIKDIEIVDLNYSDIELINLITNIRVVNKLKLPDAIIAATALYKSAILITKDKGFSTIASLHTLPY